MVGHPFAEHGDDEIDSCGESAVERGVADSRLARDLIEGRVQALL
jgi:hypothetical protein